MKKKKILFITLIPMIVTLVGCGKGETYHPVKKINDYIYEVDSYESLDYDYADKYFKENNDNWGGGCSAVSTLIDGDRFVGRNMDLNISEKCAYVVRTKANTEKKEYKTVGLAYTFRKDSPDFAEVEAHKGIGDQWYRILPFMCDDVLNSEGLHIEINMRHAEFYPNGEDKFSCENTTDNPEARRIYVFEVPRYVGSHCATVEEAKEYLTNSVSLYNKKNYWNYAFVISDATGDTVLAEVAANEIRFMEPDDNGNVMQTNFYRNPDWNAIQDIRTGEGRLEYMRDNIEKVTTKEGLFNLMEYINYFQYYSTDCKFDRRSEVVGEAGFLTYDFVRTIITQAEFQALLNWLYGPVASMSRAQLRAANSYWETTFTEVVDCANKTIYVKIYEKIQKDDPDPTYLKIDLTSTTVKTGKEDLFD